MTSQAPQSFYQKVKYFRNIVTQRKLKGGSTPPCSTVEMGPRVKKYSTILFSKNISALMFCPRRTHYRAFPRHSAMSSATSVN